MIISNYVKTALKVVAIGTLLMTASCKDDPKDEPAKKKAPSTQVREPIKTQNPTQNNPTQTTQRPIDWDGCGDQYYCDRGNGTIELPLGTSQMLGGFDEGDIRKCMTVAERNGIPTYGPWSIDSVERSITIGNQSVNLGTGASSGYNNMYVPQIKMLNVKNYLSTVDIILDEPNTIYCIKSQSVFSAPTFKSCYPNNVIFLEDNKWLAANEYIVPMSCGGTPIWNDRRK